MCFVASAICLWSAFRGYRRGAMEVGDESMTFFVGKKEKPGRFWVAFISSCILTVAFSGFGVYSLSRD